MRSFRGPLGAQCAGEACKLPVVKFQPVPGAVEEISEQLVKELSTDQQLLYRLARAVQSDDLRFADREPFCNILAITSRVLQNVTVRRDIGAFNHALWLTRRPLAPTLRVNRAPLCSVNMNIGTGSAATAAARPASKTCCAACDCFRELPSTTQRFVKLVTMRSTHWAHPEQLLLAMVVDGDRNTRQQAVRLIRRVSDRQQAERKRCRCDRSTFRPSTLVRIESTS